MRNGMRDVLREREARRYARSDHGAARVIGKRGRRLLRYDMSDTGCGFEPLGPGFPILDKPRPVGFRGSADVLCEQRSAEGDAFGTTRGSDTERPDSRKPDAERDVIAEAGRMIAAGVRGNGHRARNRRRERCLTLERRQR